MTYEDLGSKPMESKGCEVAEKSPSIYYPSFHVTKDEAPSLKIGEVVEAKVKIKLVGVSKRDYDKGRYSCDFEVHGIDFGAKQKKTDGEKLADVMDEDMKEMDKD